MNLLRLLFSALTSSPTQMLMGSFCEHCGVSTNSADAGPIVVTKDPSKATKGEAYFASWFEAKL